VSTITKRLTVDQYDQMVENGILPETNRFELINGRIVEKEVKNPEHSTALERTRRAIERILPGGWYVRQEQPVRIPNRRSEPEPDVSVVRGGIDDYATRHPDPEDVALIVEVTRSSVAKDRALARVYGGGGIPVYWIVNVPRRRLEVYEGPGPQQGRGRRYPASKILREPDTVFLKIDGREVGQIAVAELLPPATP
jgi:Uma2 family endonuclease